MRGLRSGYALCTVLSVFLGLFGSLTARADNPFPYIYVANGTANDVLVVDSDTNSVVQSISVANPSAGVVSPDGTKLYVAGYTGLSVIDAASGSTITTVSILAGIADVAITPDGSKVYLTYSNPNGPQSVMAVSTATNTVIATIPYAGDSLSGIAISPDGKKVYAANTMTSQIEVIDTATNTQTATIASGQAPTGIAITPDGTKLYVATSNPSANAVTVISTTTNNPVATIPVGTQPSSIAISPDGKKVYVTNAGGNTVSVISTTTNTVIATISGFSEPEGIAFTPSGAFVYVFNIFSRTISIVSTSSNSIVSTISGLSSVGGAFNVFAGPTRGQSTLQINVAGTGAGQVTSSPAGITCGSSCSASFATGSSVTLTAAPANGSTFAGWSGGGCTGVEPCTTILAANTTISANFVANIATSIVLQASVLPTSRSVEVGSTATLFGTMINVGPGTATNCSVTPATSVPATFSFQTTNSSTNLPTGSANTPVSIPQGGVQSFVLAFTPSNAFSPTDVALTFVCSNANAAASYSGINTLLLSASTTPVVDVIGLVATATNDGTLHIGGASGTGAFAVAAANVGTGGQIFASADTGSATLPLNLTICQTNPTNGACLESATSAIPTTLTAGGTGTYSVFATATGTVPFSPAVNRIFVRFVDSNGITRGSTSVAVTTTQ